MDAIALDSLSAAAVLLLAACLDYIIGDPWGWPHPVRVMGWAITRFTQFAIAFGAAPWAIAHSGSEQEEKQAKLTASECVASNARGEVFTNFFEENASLHRWQRRWAGIVLGVGLIIGSGLAGWFVVQGARWIHPLVGIAVESIVLASCFAGRSLRTAAVDVLQPLTDGHIDRARSQLSQYVGRDTKQLDEPEILRAVLETVTENATDGVTAPLFYAIIGAFLPGVGSAPLALAYKAASTLDSMVGYRVEPYTDLGWFSAKLEDYLTWLPCRLTVITLALMSGNPQNVWHLCLRDAPKDPSPNSGWSECTYAAILGVQLGGTNWYQGVAKHKPFLGDPVYPITPEKINQALELTRYCILIWLGGAIASLFIVHGSWFMGKLPIAIDLIR
ncbi:MAG: adenosylcobinamide-phosphate synthase CbiB [Coleofasciculaceae cyanobacterium]